MNKYIYSYTSTNYVNSDKKIRQVHAEDENEVSISFDFELAKHTRLVIHDNPPIQQDIISRSS